MKLTKLQIYYIAKVCHEAIRAWFLANYDASERHWHDAETWERESMIKYVEFRLRNPDACVETLHYAWTKDKLDSGWRVGRKDFEMKTHPCLIPFSELPEFQKTKYVLFSAIVDAIK
ncbi:MAG TPA: RyR domain-containing protein [Cyclobacteriaceae bacterium]